MTQHGFVSAFALTTAAVTLLACNTSGRNPDGSTDVRSLTDPALAAAPSDDGALRVLENDELSPAIIGQAKRILDEHSDEPFGYEVPFELEGKRYIGRIEEHYHPPGSTEGPNGEHVGVTVYVYE